MISWLKKRQEQILAIGWRLVAYEIFNYIFNYPIYAWAMAYMGLVQGWLAMTTASFASCAYLFWRYDRDGVDWLFANEAKEWVEGTSQASGWFRKMLVRVSRSKTGWTGVTTFILASINIDPLIVAVHYRKKHFKGTNVHDWSLLAFSVVIANLWWGARIGLLVEILRWLSQHF
jgi:hypothetical protein